LIRPAMDKDADDLARIYNSAVTTGADAPPNAGPVDRENRLRWIAEHVDPYPAFVYENREGKVVGWSSLGRFTVRPLLSSIAEVSVYVSEADQGSFVGARMLLHLLARAAELNFSSLFAMSFATNQASLRGLMALGFRQVGVLVDTAFLERRWESDVWLQKDLRRGWKADISPALIARLAGNLI
jgi:L-amino acid N-acyltransferase YncA